MHHPLNALTHKPPRWRGIRSRGVTAACLAAVFLFSACDQQPSAPEKKDATASLPEGIELRAIEFAKMPGWEDDRLTEALPALQETCTQTLQRKDEQASMGPLPPAGTVKQWKDWCRGLLAQVKKKESEQSLLQEVELRNYLQTTLQPYAISFQGSSQGTFTGYYEATLKGSLTRKKGYDVPIYGVPEDLVSLDLSDQFPDMKGQKVVARLQGQYLYPYWTRKEIDDGAISLRAPVVAWGADPIDVYMLHVQGSGVLQLEDGSSYQIGYAGNNGHPFKGIGKTLLEKGLLEPGQSSMPAIRQWLQGHPEQRTALLQENNRFIFFRPIKANGPLGAYGAPLTPRRSMAVDSRYVPLGVPLWLNTQSPDGDPLQRLMMAQDVGSAIKGGIRGDFYWGSGEEALAQAGRMKSQGEYFLLLPKTAL